MPSAWFLATFVHWGTESQSPTSSSTTTPRIRSSTSFWKVRNISTSFFGRHFQGGGKIQKNRSHQIFSKWQTQWARKQVSFDSRSLKNPQYLPKKILQKNPRRLSGTQKNGTQDHFSWQLISKPFKTEGFREKNYQSPMILSEFDSISKLPNKKTENQLGQISNPSTKLWYVLNHPSYDVQVDVRHLHEGAQVMEF